MTCKDCFHWVVCQGDAPYYSAGAEHCTSWASAEDINAPTKWIPVTERLPDNNQCALCLMKDGVLGWALGITLIGCGRTKMSGAQKKMSPIGCPYPNHRRWMQNDQDFRKKA